MKYCQIGNMNDVNRKEKKNRPQICCRRVVFSEIKENRYEMRYFVRNKIYVIHNYLLDVDC